MFQGEGHHIDRDEAEPRENIYASMKAPPGHGGYVEKDQIIDESENEGTEDPLAQLLREEEGAGLEESDDTEDASYEEGLNDVTEKNPFTKYAEHGVATEEEAEKANLPGSLNQEKVQPNLPSGMRTRQDDKGLFPSKTKRANRSKPPYKDHH